MQDDNHDRLSTKTFERAINLLTYRARTVAEMRERLLEKPWAKAEIVEQVIEKLLGYGYLNDQEFARDFAASRLRQKPVGRRLLQQKLSLKKLAGDVITKALEECYQEVPEDSLVEAAIERRLGCQGLPTSHKDLKRLCDYLMRQGFSPAVVFEKLRRLYDLRGLVRPTISSN